MLKNILLQNLLCIDIETVPAQPSIKKLDGEWKDLWEIKSARLRDEKENPEEHYFNHAAIYSEFGKVICITIGIFFRKDKKSPAWKFRLKTFSGDDERKLLEDFSSLLKKYYTADKYLFCGHNVREFDIPYLCRRMLALQIEIPQLMDVSGKKPYEVKWVDTMQLWRFGDYKHYTSLRLLAAVLGLPSPKTDLDGKDVGRVYWKENGLDRIVEYNRRDVITVAQMILRFKNLPLLAENEITFAD